MGFHVHENFRPISQSDREKLAEGKRPQHDYTMIHVGKCKLCNYGAGIHANVSNKNSTWHPKDSKAGFDTYTEARGVAESRERGFGPYLCTKPDCAAQWRLLSLSY